MGLGPFVSKKNKYKRLINNEKFVLVLLINNEKGKENSYREQLFCIFESNENIKFIHNKCIRFSLLANTSS